MGKLEFPLGATSSEKMMLSQLHRLTGAYLTVQTREVKRDELSLDLDKAVMTRFMNRGQAPILIDNQIMLLPGDTYVEGDSNGPGIDHTYKLEFQPQNKDDAAAPGVDKPFVYAGKHVSIRSLYRKY